MTAAPDPSTTPSTPSPDAPVTATSAAPDLRVEPPGTWWRRNRWYVVVLPVALLLAVAGYTYRLPEYLFNREYVVALGTAEPGRWLSVRDPGSDAVGDFVRTYRVQLDSTKTLRAIPGPDEPTPWLAQLPEGTEVVEVSLNFEADPEQLLSGCSMWVMDDQGRSYGTESRYLLPGNTNPCVPEEHPGPDTAFVGQKARPQVTPDQMRPSAWTTKVLFLVPRGVQLTEVRIGWDFPHYARVKL